MIISLFLKKEKEYNKIAFHQVMNKFITLKREILYQAYFILLHIKEIRFKIQEHPKRVNYYQILKDNKVKNLNQICYLQWLFAMNRNQKDRDIK